MFVPNRPRSHKEVTSFQDMDRRRGVSYLEQFAKACSSAGYAIRAVRADHGHWCEMPRDRLWILGFSKDAGHARGADWAVAGFEEVLAKRTMLPPTPAFTVVDPLDPAEIERREMAAQAIL